MSERKNEAAWIESRNRWQINVQADGVRKTFISSKPGKKGKIEAERKADEWLETQIIGGNTRCNVLLDLFLAQKKQTTSHTNSSQIEYHIRCFIRPVIGLKRIDRVTEDDLQAIIDLAHAAGRYHKTLTNIRATTQAFIKFCRKKKVTILFPENLVIPRNAPKKEKHIAGPEDIRKLFTLSTTYWHLAERPDWYIHAYRFAVLTGLRPGEYLGYAGQMSQMRGLLFDAPTTMTVNSPPAKMKMPIGLWLCRASLNKSWKLSVICCEETQSSRLIYFHLLNLKLQHRSDIGTAGNDIVDTIGFPIPPHMNCAIPMSA